MEGQPAKRRRVYSLQPNKVEQATFARNYMNYLVPALMKIKERSPSEHSGHCDIQNVKYEVDMAMVHSAQGFAWSNALSVKLQRDRVNADSDTTRVGEKHKVGGEGSSRTCGQNGEMVPLKHFPSNPTLKPRNKHKGMAEMTRGLREEDEDEVTNGQLKSLRMLIPGGEEMCSEQMVTELQSYVSCLQMQVNILQCLAETH